MNHQAKGSRGGAEGAENKAGLEPQISQISADFNAYDPEEKLQAKCEELLDAIMARAEVVPWGGRWAARVPRVIGPCIEGEWLTALNALRRLVGEDLTEVADRLSRQMRKERLGSA